MTSRLLTAYALIAALGLGALAALWFGVVRERWARARRRRRYDRERATALPSTPVKQAYELD